MVSWAVVHGVRAAPRGTANGILAALEPLVSVSGCRDWAPARAVGRAGARAAVLGRCVVSGRRGSADTRLGPSLGRAREDPGGVEVERSRETRREGSREGGRAGAPGTSQFRSLRSRPSSHGINYSQLCVAVARVPGLNVLEGKVCLGSQSRGAVRGSGPTAWQRALHHSCHPGGMEPPKAHPTPRSHHPVSPLKLGWAG